MAAEASTKYGTQKISYLKQCVRITEDLLTHVSDSEMLCSLLQQREDVLALLTELEKTHIEAASDHEITKVDQLVHLLQELDSQVVSTIKKEQQDTLSALKVNVNEHKFTAYSANPMSPKGKFLDKKR